MTGFPPTRREVKWSVALEGMAELIWVLLSSALPAYTRIWESIGTPSFDCRSGGGGEMCQRGRRVVCFYIEGATVAQIMLQGAF